MLNQYLIDPNNPPTPEVEARLIAAGVRFVVPTPIPVQEDMIAEEREAVLDGDVWRQVWELVPAPETEVPIPTLTRPQFEFLLGVTGLADVWGAVEQAVKAVDMVQYGLLRGLRARDSFRYETTLAMVGQFAPFLPPGVTLDDTTLRPRWLQAAAADI